MKNSIDHPEHYNHGNKYEPWDVIADWGLNFDLGNSVKYIARAGYKDSYIDDLKKARNYLDHAISREEQNDKN